MSASTELPPLRVEQALRLLPDIDALAPLRAFLVSTSRTRPIGTRTSDEQDRTVGKRFLQVADLRGRVPQAIARVTRHLSELYEAAVHALEAEQRGDMSTAVLSLLDAGGCEEHVGRYSQAHEWYRHALGIAEELRDRRPEIAGLSRLGGLELARGNLEEGAREYQRSLAVAEGEGDNAGAGRACLGLGNVAMAQSQWGGAEAWYSRGLRYAEGDPLLTAQLTLKVGESALHQRQLELAADRLRQARETFEALNAVDDTIRAFVVQGQLAAAGGHTGEALRAYLEALQLLPRRGRETGANDPRLEMDVRLRLSELHLEAGRIPDAEDEARRAEELAIAHNLTRQLAMLYTIMGRLRTRQADENGFVFFEKAIELCGGLEPAPRLAAETYVEYAEFRRTIGELDEARAYLERAREILELVGDGLTLKRIEAELQHLPPA